MPRRSFRPPTAGRATVLPRRKRSQIFESSSAISRKPPPRPPRAAAAASCSILRDHHEACSHLVFTHLSMTRILVTSQLVDLFLGHTLLFRHPLAYPAELVLIPTARVPRRRGGLHDIHVRQHPHTAGCDAVGERRRGAGVNRAHPVCIARPFSRCNARHRAVSHVSDPDGSLDPRLLLQLYSLLRVPYVRMLPRPWCQAWSLAHWLSPSHATADRPRVFTPLQPPRGGHEAAPGRHRAAEQPARTHEARC